MLIDSGHLINMVRLRLGQPLNSGVPADWVGAYASLSSQLRSGFCILVFYEPLCYEWIVGNSNARSDEIASFLDDAACIRAIPVEDVIIRAEAIEEALRAEPAISLPSISIFRAYGPDPALAAWARLALPDEARRIVSVPVQVRDPDHPRPTEILAGIRPSVCEAATASEPLLELHRAMLRETREAQAKYGRPGLPPDMWKRQWLHSAWGFEPFLRRFCPSLDSVGLIRRMDLSRCRALSLKFDVLWQYARATAEGDETENDVIDLMLSAPLAYVDYALIEKRTAELVRQSRHPEISARVFREPIALLRSMDERPPPLAG